MSEPFISVVVPVHNGGRQLETCLAAVLDSDYRACETIVVDDGSTDESFERAAASGCRVIRLDVKSGPGAARNHGARAARGDVLLFVDADVVVRSETVARVAGFFHQNQNAAAVFGSYDDAPAERNFVSQYKNLLHHFVHQQSCPKAETFWAGCGAVRREAFEAAGGFDERRYPRPSIEDIELGYRLRRAGREIVLDKGLQVKHLKRWTLWSLLRSDIFDRAIPWARLILESREILNDLNLRVSDRLSAALAGVSVLLLALAPVAPVLLVPALAALAVVLFLNRKLYGFFLRKRGVWFAARSAFMQLLYYLYSGSAFVLCWCAHAINGKKEHAHRPAHAPETSRTHDA